MTFGYHRTLPTLTISICFSKLLKFSPEQIPRTNFCQRKKESSRIKLFFYGFWHGKLIKSLKFAPFWEKKGSNHHIQTKCAPQVVGIEWGFFFFFSELKPNLADSSLLRIASPPTSWKFRRKKTLVVRLLVASSPNLQACKSKMLLSCADFGGTTCVTRKLIENYF